jgi:hypothetical protein
MCGRFALTLSPRKSSAAYGYVEAPNFPPRYNIAPTQPVAVVLEEEGARHFRLMRWGFLPSWVKDPKDFPLVINARRETLTEKATFRNAIRRRRCIFLADHFYEWRREGREKQPFAIRMKDGGPSAAGRPVGDLQRRLRRRNRHRRHRHHRRQRRAVGHPPPHAGDPGGDEIAPWLAPETPLDDVLALTRPCPEEWLADVSGLEAGEQGGER